MPYIVYFFLINRFAKLLVKSKLDIKGFLGFLTINLEIM